VDVHVTRVSYAAGELKYSFLMLKYPSMIIFSLYCILYSMIDWFMFRIY
jgi:hypothetical protein